MTEHVQHIKRFRDNGATAETTHDIISDEANERSGISVMARLVWFAAAVIIALLAIRFIFILAGANQGNGFVDFIYNVSHPFAAPFFGIFGYSVRYGVSRLEFASLIGIVIYMLAAWGLADLMMIRRSR